MKNSKTGITKNSDAFFFLNQKGMKISTLLFSQKLKKPNAI
jgi:hypothetical protein